MKKVSILGVSLLSSIAFAVVLFFNACTNDPCKDVNCLNGGNCVDGICACPAGYEGTDCGTKSVTKFIGSGTTTWHGIDNCTTNTYEYTATITASSASAVSILINNFGGFGITTTWTATVDKSTFTIANQTINGITINGTGTISSDLKTITVTYTANDGSITDSCNGTWTLQ